MIRGGIIWFLVNLVVGVYFVNLGLGLVTLPEFILSINNWIMLAGGILVIIGGIMSLRRSSGRYR